VGFGVCIAPCHQHAGWSLHVLSYLGFIRRGTGGGGGRKERERRQGEKIKREKIGRKEGRKETRFLVFISHSRRLIIVSEEGHNLTGLNGMAGSRDTVKY